VQLSYEYRSKNMKKLLLTSMVFIFSQSAFSATYTCSMVSKIDEKMADLISVPVELTSDMKVMAEIKEKDSETIYAQAAIKQAGDTLFLEIHEKPNSVIVIEGKAGSPLSYFYSNSADRSVKVECKP
jgi:hypothetical protein